MGQEYTKVLARNFYSGSSACLIVFDVTDETSYRAVREWKRELDNKIDDIPVFILANKVASFSGSANPVTLLIHCMFDFSKT